ncbi:MAG TPA: metallopeptidase family protein [Acidimicrobiales bacterium]|nr:metallopeptidase family protein [Acidimicrobiales bacterium]
MWLDGFEPPARAERDRETGLGLARRYAALMFEVSNERFEELAEEALKTLPHELAVQIENLAIIVDDSASGGNLFGLYEGIPLTKRGPLSYSGVMPDRITLYQTTICDHCRNEDEVKAQIRKTVIHEVAHHFGISDPRLEELGWA